MKVSEMTDLDIKRHQKNNWTAKDNDTVYVQLACKIVGGFTVDRYRQYLEKVESRQGNVTDGFV